MITNIVYASDNNYAKQLAVSIYSLCKNSNCLFSLYILDNGIKGENKRIIRDVCKQFNKKIYFIDLIDIEERLPVKVAVNKLSICTYSRLFLPDLLPDTVDYLLYLDCDTVINGNLNDLMNIDISEYDVAGVEDCMYPAYKETIGLTKNDRYLNAGILLINLLSWRNNNMTKHFLNFIELYNGNVPHLDQGVINGVIKNKLYLPLKYNVQSVVFSFNHYQDILSYFDLSNFYSENEVKNAKINPVIIHYTSFFLQRPWFTFSLHPLKNVYRSYLKELFPDVALVRSPLSHTNKIQSYIFVHLQDAYLLLKRVKNIF